MWSWVLKAVLAEVQGRLAPAEPKVRTPVERALKLAEIVTALRKAKRHEVKLMEQLEAQERKVRSTKATLNEQSAKVAQLEAEAQEAKRLVTGGTLWGRMSRRRWMSELALCILMTSWLEGSMRMIIWECPKSTTLSQTREPGW